MNAPFLARRCESIDNTTARKNHRADVFSAANMANFIHDDDAGKPYHCRASVTLLPTTAYFIVIHET
jgi:hypothetical protein